MIDFGLNMLVGILSEITAIYFGGVFGFLKLSVIPDIWNFFQISLYSFK